MKCILPIAIIGAVMLAVGCAKISDSIDKEDIEVTLVTYAKEQPPARPAPILMYEFQNSVLAQYYDPDEPDQLIYFFRQAGQDRDIMMVADKDNILFFPAKNTNKSLYCALLSRENGLQDILYGVFNTVAGQFLVTGNYPIEVQLASTKRAYNYGDDIRRSFLNDLVLKFKDQEFFGGIDAYFPDFMPVGTIFRHIMQTLTITGMQVIAKEAGDDLKEEIAYKTVEVSRDAFVDDMADLASIGAGKAVAKTLKVKVAVMPYSSTTKIASHVFRFMDKARTGEFPSEDAVTYGSSLFTNNVFNQSTRMAPAMSNLYLTEDSSQTHFILSCNVSNITKNSATISGTSAAGSGYGHAADVVMEQGFRLTERRTGNTQHISSSGLASKTVDLKPATAYVASSYVHTLSGRDWYSTPVAFITRGTLLEFSPSSAFRFPLEGGEQATGVTVGDCASWKVLSAPAWCKVYYSTSSIQVVASKTSIDRQGEIVVETTSYYGEKERATIQVSQSTMMSWDGTSWHFEEVGDSPHKGSFDLTVTSVADEIFSISYWPNPQRAEIYCDSEGRLIITLSNYEKHSLFQGYLYAYYLTKHTFERIDYRNAKATTDGESGGGSSGYVKTGESHAEFVGTLVE